MDRDTWPLIVRADGREAYRICIDSSFDKLKDALKSLDTKNRKVCIVTDSSVGPLYAAEVSKIFQECFAFVTVLTLPAGEQYKNLDQIRTIYQHLIEQKFDRKDMLAALGGGVVGDMTGFAAATYVRGISFLQIPTTLLSMVDSSIGGKTGVDFGGYKNMVGAFHMPSLVFINTQTLNTLPDEQFASGMGEILKHGLIRDAEYYDWTIAHREEIEKKDPVILQQLIFGSCRIKGTVVENDPTEQGERALLNFGHTIGHAIEAAKNFTLPHGQCVALGCTAAAYISRKRNLLDEEEFCKIRDTNPIFLLPVSFDHLSTDTILENMKHDKKVKNGRIRFVLLDGIGHAVLSDDVSEEEMRMAIQSLNADNM